MKWKDKVLDYVREKEKGTMRGVEYERTRINGNSSAVAIPMGGVLRKRHKI